ncbi:MAG TPA: hypothetical protein VFC46_03865 [Humisphaera sp.]|nr:hypothetical protein [Humisphaera sp.]
MIQTLSKFRAIRLVIALAILGGFAGGCFDGHDRDHHDHDWHESHDHYDHDRDHY